MDDSPWGEHYEAPATRRRRTPPPYTTYDLPLAVVLFGVQLVVVLGTIAITAVSGMISDSCGDGRCDLALMEASAWIVIIGGFVLFALCVLAAGLRRGRGHPCWWIPLVGSAATIAVFFVGQALLYASVDQSFV